MSAAIAQLLRDATKRLTAAGVETPSTDASALLGAAAGGSYLSYDTVPADIERKFHEMIARREAREPVSHILGRRVFWKHDFIVTKDVLDPRPDTETLVELALEHRFERVLDLGTGSGCIILSLLAERSDSTGVGVDLSPASLDIARQNASNIGVADRVAFQASDWFENVTGQFDMIVSNPPYISEEAFAALAPEVRVHEPKLALTAGQYGLDCYIVIAKQAKRHLRAGGQVLVEIGFDQRDAVTELFLNEDYQGVTCHLDLAGKDRVISARRG